MKIWSMLLPIHAMLGLRRFERVLLSLQVGVGAALGRIKVHEDEIPILRDEERSGSCNSPAAAKIHSESTPIPYHFLPIIRVRAPAR